MLSEPLKKALMVESYKLILKESPMFVNNFSDQCLMEIGPLIQEINAVPSQTIVQKGESETEDLYFVVSGQLNSVVETPSGFKVL